MPRRTSMRRRGGMRRKMRGRGFFDFFKKIGSWFKKNKVISRVGNALGSVGVPYASTVGNVAGAIGLGRRRRIKSGALRLAGGARRRRR